MKTLVLEKFKCLIDNDGDDSDSPYFVCFVGHPSFDFVVTMSTVFLQHLDDTVASTGAWTEVNEQIVREVVDDKTFVLVALLERDDGIDLTDEEVNALRDRMAGKWLQIARDEHVHGDRLVKRMRKEFRRAINSHTNNDDLIGIRHLPIPSSGQPAHLLIENDPDDGAYTVAFRLTGK
jgi:hypothetical protein